ncbi:MAG: hypothetical protein D6805_00770 [Planctomycetota bacterium]|nr:MAG: hypothetical protein D6805_00770 [Planctomycetota bacterium]
MVFLYGTPAILVLAIIFVLLTKERGEPVQEDIQKNLEKKAAKLLEEGDQYFRAWFKNKSDKEALKKAEEAYKEAKKTLQKVKKWVEEHGGQAGGYEKDLSKINKRLVSIHKNKGFFD